MSFDNLLSILKTAAPALATAVAGPAGGLAVQLIADKLGIDDKTVKGVTEALQNNPDLQLKLREIDLKELELNAQDRRSARGREAAIATSEAAPMINKVVTPVLALGGSPVSNDGRGLKQPHTPAALALGVVRPSAMTGAD